MRRLYLAGPMTGIADFNYPAFEEARARLTDAGFDVLCPTDNGAEHEVGAMPWDWYMREALKQVVAADALAVLPGSALSRGAMLEIHIARSLGMDVRAVDEWLATPTDSEEE